MPPSVRSAYHYYCGPQRRPGSPHRKTP